MKFMRLVAFVAISAIGIVYAELAVARDLKVSSFNIRFYGDDDDPSDRDAKLRRHVKKFADDDIIAFQEIINKSRFYRKVKPSSHYCQSYPSPREGHLHVLLCYRRDRYKLKKVGSDSDYIINSVSLDRYRPAVYGLLTDLNDRPITYIVAVHLKAQEDRSEVRMEQVELMAKRLRQLNPQIPIIVTGDFNTHGSDSYRMTRIFEHNDLDLVQEQVRQWYTYRTPDTANKLDHFWLSDSITVKRRATAQGPCNLNLNSYENLAELEDYNDIISDHCAVRVTLSL